MSTALRIADRLAEYRPAWFEEPVRHQQMGAMVEVARRSPVPVATGESFTSITSSPTCSATTPSTSSSPSRSTWAGLWRTRQVAAMADAHYAVVAPHNAQGPVCGAVSTQLGACIPNFYVQESFDEFNADWTREIVDRPVLPVDGYVEVPDGPGARHRARLGAPRGAPLRRRTSALFAPGWERRDDAPDGTA